VRAIIGAPEAYPGVITVILRLKSGAVEAKPNKKVNSVAMEGHPGAMEYQPGILEAPIEP
jgi:hypothetical protein